KLYLIDLFSVFLLMFLKTLWILVLPAPTPNTCKWKENCNLIKLLEFEAQQLKETYVGNTLRHCSDTLPLLFSIVECSTSQEQLQDIYTKAFLFRWHISNVEIYEKDLLPHPELMVDSLKTVNSRLEQINYSLQNAEPELAALSTPAPPQLSHDDDHYLKKVYVWGVIYTLRDWVTQVLQLLKCDQVEDTCDRK
uniref:Ciliary neurotrophic factor n=1 Tax=Salarias fasciatus TaxID=181472 RepID=A0A672IEF7_SALFA